MGAGLTVAPNTIDFNAVFDNLDEKLVENVAVVGTVVGVIILYIPLLLLSRRLDKNDKHKVIVTRVYLMYISMYQVRVKFASLVRVHHVYFTVQNVKKCFADFSGKSCL